MGQELVDRATSDTLIAPDWVLNNEICNDINQDARLVKDVVKALKKRIVHKNPKVQILALSLLESLIKNCGEVVHAFVAEREILKEMVKIAKKKPDLRVKQKILLLIGTWQEVFEGPLGMYPQYYAAYQELLHAGFIFPEKKEASTALVVHPHYQQTLPLQNDPTSEQAEYRHIKSQPPARSYLSRLMSFSDIKDARNATDILSTMLNDLDPGTKEGLNQDVIINLVQECRTNKERVVKLLNSTTDEYVISKAAALKDDLEKVLAFYEAISGEPILTEKSPISPKQDDDSVDQETSSEADDSRSVASTNKDDKPPPQQPALPVPSPESTATPPAPAKAEEPLIDLLSGDDFLQPKPDENALAVVLYEPNHTASNEPVSSLTHMFDDLLSDNPNDNLSSYTSQNLTILPSPQHTVHPNRTLPDQHLPETMPWHAEPTVHDNRNVTGQHLPETMPWHVEQTVHASRNSPDQHLPETMPWHVEPIVHANRNSPDQHLPETMPWHAEPTVHANRNVTGQHLSETMQNQKPPLFQRPWHVKQTVYASRNLPDQHLPKTMPWHVKPVVHANSNSPDQHQPETMTWHVEPTYYANGGNDNSMAWTSHDTKFQMNNANNQWNNVTGTGDHNESLPPPPWETEATDITPFQDNQMGFQTYPTQQLQPFPTQQPQLHLTQQPQAYPTQQPLQSPTQQPQPYLTHQPQQKQDKQHGFVPMMSRQMAIQQDRSLPPMETSTYSPYSQMQNASPTNQQALYANQIDPHYNQNTYTYGYGNSYGALNQENHSVYNSQMPTSTMLQQTNKFRNLWNGGTFQ